MAPSIRTQKASTNNTNPSFNLAAGSDVFSGDLIVFIMEDTATGTTATFATAANQQLEGLSVGADWSVTTSDCDILVNDSTNSRFIRVWSARIDAAPTAVDFTISGTYAGGSGIRRSQLFVVGPDATVPVRASRIAGTVAVTNTTAGGNTVDAFSLSGTTSVDAALIGGFYTANTMASSPVLDANGDGSTYEATALVNGNGCGAFAQAYDSSASVRPAIPANVKWVSTPGAGGKSFVFVEYKLETPAVTGVALLSGGGTSAATGTTKKSGTAILAGGGVSSATGTRKVLGTSVLAGGGTLFANAGAPVKTGTATITGTALFAAAGGRTRTGTTTFPNTVVFTSSGTRKVVGVAHLTGGGTLTCIQRIPVLTYSAGGSWSSSSILVPGGRTMTGTSVLAGAGTLAATGHVAGVTGGVARLQTTVTLTSTGVRKVTGVALLAGVGTFRATEGNVVNVSQNDLLSVSRSSRVTLNTRSRISLKG